MAAGKPAPKANPPHGQPGHVHGDEGEGGLDDDPRQLAAQFDLVQRELQRSDRRLATIEEALVETQQASSALRAMADGDGGREILLPLGAGVHVAARLAGEGKVLMPLGAGYFSEDTPDAVAKALQERIEALTQQFQAASEDAQRLAQATAAINDRLSQFQE